MKTRFCRDLVVVLVIAAFIVFPMASFAQKVAKPEIKQLQGPQNPRIGFIIHGGAGVIRKGTLSPEREKAYRDKLAEVVLAGYKALQEGKSSLDAVEIAIRMMEDDPLFNAGKGAVFSFILHFKKTSGDITSAPDIESQGALEGNKNIHVLVVEDIALNQLLMKTLLDDFGFKRDIAANGKLAIEKLKEKKYDIVLMDLQMPEMNGFEATEYIRNTLHSDIPIIALTADVTTVDLAKCRAVGMNDYIAKPVDERILFSKIMGLVKNRQEIRNTPAETAETAVAVKLRCIDLAYLVSITKCDAKLMMEMIELYLEQTPGLVETIKKSLQEKDWESLHTAAHKMIPSFSIMGISPEFEAMTKKLQDYTGSKKQLTEIQGLVLQVENICAQACTELEEEYKTLKNTRS